MANEVRRRGARVDIHRLLRSLRDPESLKFLGVFLLLVLLAPVPSNLLSNWASARIESWALPSWVVTLAAALLLLFVGYVAWWWAQHWVVPYVQAEVEGAADRMSAKAVVALLSINIRAPVRQVSGDGEVFWVEFTPIPEGSPKLVQAGDVEGAAHAQQRWLGNWQQLLRAIHPHWAAGRQRGEEILWVILVGSRGKGQDQGSCGQFATVKLFLEDMMPGLRVGLMTKDRVKGLSSDDGLIIAGPDDGVDFDSFDQVKHRVSLAVGRAKKLADCQADDVVVDITSGTKAASGGAVLATLGIPGLHVQYVKDGAVGLNPQNIMTYEVKTRTSSAI